MMPRMDGLTLLHGNQAHRRNATVILMTGQGNEDVLLKALRGGATNFFKKPFNVRELIEEIRKVVDFRLEAARSTLFSPHSSWRRRRRSCIPDADSPLLPHHQPDHPPAALPPAGGGDPQPQDRDRGDDHQRHRARQPRHQLRGEEQGHRGGAARRAHCGTGGRAERRAGRRVVITSRLGSDLFEITIRDEGAGIRLAGAARRWPRRTSSRSTAGGSSSRRSISTRSQYNEEGNEVTLRKTRRRRVHGLRIRRNCRSPGRWRSGWRFR